MRQPQQGDRVPLSGIPHALLQDRYQGHWWDEFTPLAPVPRTGVRHDFKCQWCGKERHEIWHRATGALVSRYYTPGPDEDFNLSLDRRYNKDELRQELIRRQAAQARADHLGKKKRRAS